MTMNTLTSSGMIMLTLALSFLVSCQSGSFDLDRYKQAVGSGFAMIPEAADIESKLGEADHFIQGDGRLWNTEVYFGGRYVLTLQVPIEVNSNFSKVTKITGKAAFYFQEVVKVTDNSGQIGADFNPNSFRQFGIDEWQKIIKANMDFSILGIKVNKMPVKRFEEYVNAVRRDRVQVRPPAIPK